MSYSKLSKFLTFSIIFTLGIMVGVVGQQQLPSPQQQPVNEDFTDEDYEKFVKINMELIPIQQEAEERMISAISDNGLEVERFQMLAQAQQQGNITDVSEDPEEISKFNEAGQEVMKVQQEVQQELQKKITDNQMDIQKFQEMSMAYNQSPTVKEKVDALIGDLE